MGTSTTHCHAYRIMASGIMMIIAANTWAEDVQNLESEADKEWLEANSVFVPVLEPVFAEEPEL